MPCYRPIEAYIAKGKTDNGKKVIVFRKPPVFMERIQLPCGQCIGCRLVRSVTWAARCMHEIQLHQDNCFITLTYDDENLPNDYSLPSKEQKSKGQSHFQLFLKRLRKDIAPRKIRYFMCGEYGGSSWRPHYHAIIFGYDFPDKQRVQSSDVDNPYFISTQLSRLWPYGFHIIAEANFDTAAYVARYCTKKVNGEKAESHYKRTILDWEETTGEIKYFKEVDLAPEYATMSRRPGIGADWYDKYKSDCYPSDYLIVDGRKVPVPKYYDKLLEKENSLKIAAIKQRRKLKAILNKEENTLARLSVREHVKKEQAKSLSRRKV